MLGISLLSKLVNKLDIAIAVFGLIMSVILIAVYFNISATMMILVIGLALLIASLIYLISRQKKTNENNDSFVDKISDTEPFFKPTSGKIASIIYWACILSAFLSLLAVPNTRCAWYFILFSVAAGSIAISILSASSKLQTAGILIRTMVLGLLARLSKFEFFEAYGDDNIGHMIMNEVLSKTGDIQSIMGLDAATKEASYPIMHINVAISDIISGLPIKEATTIGVYIPVIISFICAFLFARLFFGNRAALFSVLILTLTDYLLAATYGTTDFGCCIYFFIMFILGKCMQKKSSLIWEGLFLVFAILLVETHAVSSAIMLVTLIAFFIGKLVYNIVYKNHEFPIKDFGHCIVFSLLIFIRSIYLLYADESSSLFESVIGPFFNRILEGSANIFSRVDSLSLELNLSEPTWSVFFDSLGFLLLITVCIFTIYVWLQKRNARPETLAIIASFLLIQFITYVFPFFGLRSIMPSRWFLFMYFFFAVIAGTAFMILLCSNKKWRFAVPVIIVFLAFFMVSGSVANNDSPLYSSDYRESLLFTFEEGAAAETLTKYAEWKLVSDFRYGYPMILRMNGYYNLNLMEYFTDTNVPNIHDKIIVWREYTLTRPITLSVTYGVKSLTGYYVLGEVFRDRLDNRYNTVYDVGGAHGYYGK